jgi:hypothetical protein
VVFFFVRSALFLFCVEPSRPPYNGNIIIKLVHCANESEAKLEGEKIVLNWIQRRIESVVNRGNAQSLLHLSIFDKGHGTGNSSHVSQEVKETRC